jgi:hypothetical protein
MAGALTIEQRFDSLAIRVKGPKTWSQPPSVNRQGDWAGITGGLVAFMFPGA